MNPFAMVTANAAATPALPTSTKGFGCDILTHAGVGTYEVTLDEPCKEVECIANPCIIGGAANASAYVTHTSDTVKVINTNLAGAPDDTLDFCCTFTRMPAGH